MSEIGLTITPNVATTQFVIDQNTIQITPDAIALNVYTQGAPVAGGTNGQLQYNNLNTLAGASNTNVSNGNVYFQNLPNLKISGGSNAYFLQTDGTGNLTWAAGTVNANSGNGIPVGANTQIQITDGTGNFVSAPGFTFDNVSNLFTAPGDGVFTGNVTANNFIGNIVGNVGNANYANFAGTVINNTQSNITSLGTLTGLSVNNFITATQFVSNTTTGTAPLVVSSTSKVANLNVDYLDGYDTSSTSVANTIVNRDANASFSANVITATTSNITNLNANNTNISNFIFGVEFIDIINAQTGNYNFDLLNGTIKFTNANATANLILNFRGNSTTTLANTLNTGQSIVGTYVLTTGSTGYGITGINIDGSAQTIKWAGGSIPTYFSNSLESYVFTIIKTANTPTYNVLGSKTRYS